MYSQVCPGAVDGVFHLAPGSRVRVHSLEERKLPVDLPRGQVVWQLLQQRAAFRESKETWGFAHLGRNREAVLGPRAPPRELQCQQSPGEHTSWTAFVPCINEEPKGWAL